MSQDKCCETCQHETKSASDPPCKHCFKVDHWQPIRNVKAELLERAEQAEKRAEEAKEEAEEQAIRDRGMLHTFDLMVEELSKENEALKAQLAKATASGAVLVKKSRDILAVFGTARYTDEIQAKNGLIEALDNLQQATKDYMAVHEAMEEEHEKVNTIIDEGNIRHPIGSGFKTGNYREYWQKVEDIRNRNTI